MTTDWWNTEAKPGGNAAEPIVVPDLRTGMPTSPPPAAPVQGEEGAGLADVQNASRKKAMKVVGLAAGVVMTGVLVMQAASGGGDAKDPAGTSSQAEQGGGLPAAGGGPQGALPAAGDGQPNTSRQGGPSASATPKVVTLRATPAGKGRVGARVEITILNGTDEPVTVLATMMKGDDRPAVVGEGTLAPGSRTVQPGGAATGTVEFTTAAAPHQVVLLDLSGNVIAASDEG